MVADRGGIAGVAVGRDDYEPVGFEPCIHDGVAGLSRSRLPLLTGGIHLQGAAQHPLVEHHRLSCSTLEVNVRNEVLPGHRHLLGQRVDLFVIDGWARPNVIGRPYEVARSRVQGVAISRSASDNDPPRPASSGWRSLRLA